MEKHLVTWSYWLGIACFAIALVWKARNAFGMWLPKSMAAGQTISYMSFYKGSLLFFLVTIATANYTWFNSRTSQS
jgi:hypothetical protein